MVCIPEICVHPQPHNFQTWPRDDLVSAFQKIWPYNFEVWAGLGGMGNGLTIFQACIGELSVQRMFPPSQLVIHLICEGAPGDGMSALPLKLRWVHHNYLTPVQHVA